jgi:hypothetical protein
MVFLTDTATSQSAITCVATVLQECGFSGILLSPLVPGSNRDAHLRLACLFGRETRSHIAHRVSLLSRKEWTRHWTPDQARLGSFASSYPPTSRPIFILIRLQTRRLETPNSIISSYYCACVSPEFPILRLNRNRQLKERTSIRLSAHPPDQHVKIDKDRGVDLSTNKCPDHPPCYFLFVASMATSGQ